MSGSAFLAAFRSGSMPSVLMASASLRLRNAVLDVDAVAFFVLFQGLDIVADLPLEADVGHQTVARLGVDAGHIACIGVAVGVAVLDVEQDDEIIAVLDGLRHGLFLLILLA